MVHASMNFLLEILDISLECSHPALGRGKTISIDGENNLHFDQKTTFKYNPNIRKENNFHKPVRSESKKLAPSNFAPLKLACRKIDYHHLDPSVTFF
jgi:hypothetical protein